MTIDSREWDPNTNPFGGQPMPAHEASGALDVSQQSQEIGVPVYPATPPEDVPPHLRQPVFEDVDEPAADSEHRDAANVDKSIVYDWATTNPTWGGTDSTTTSDSESALVVSSPTAVTTGGLALTTTIDSGTLKPTITERVANWREDRRIAQNAERERLATETEKAEAERQATLHEREEESLIRYADAALKLKKSLEFPVTYPENDEKRSPMYKQREVQALFLTRFVNGVIASKVSELLHETYPELETTDEIREKLESAIDSMLDSAVDDQTYSALNVIRARVPHDAQMLETVCLLDVVAKTLDRGGKHSIFNKTDAALRKKHDEDTITAVQKIIDMNIEEATKEHIINPFPEHGIPHRVFAFEVLQNALKLSEQEATIDDYNTQPAVVTRLIYNPDGTITVDPHIDGIGKLYASFGYTPDDSFGGFTFYETTAEGRPDPRNITGLVQKKAPFNQYEGYFAVHMKLGSVTFDDISEDPEDGSVAFFAKFQVNPLLIEPHMNTIVLNGMSKVLITSGMQAQPVNHPTELTKPSVKALAGWALPGEQMLVEAAITANRAGQEQQRATLAQELARVNDSIRNQPFAPPALGTAVNEIETYSSEQE